MLPLWSIDNKESSVDPLKPFAERQALIEYVPDAETKRAASNIAESLEHAGWKIAKFSPVDRIEDGVEIEAYSKPPGQRESDDTSREWQIHIESSKAVDALVDFLHSYNWQARIASPRLGANDIPPDGIKVRVGLYPAVTFVSPPGGKDPAAAEAQFHQEMEKNTKQIEERLEKHDTEILKNMTAQHAAQFKAREAQGKREEQAELSRYSSPCQPLNPVVPSQ